MAIERVNVGNVEIVSVTDGAMRGTPAFFLAGVTPDVYTPALGDDLREDGTFAIEFGSFLVRSSGKNVLVDTGLGNKLPGETGGMLLENLKQIGVSPGDIDVVVNTHLHVDHVGWNCTESDGGYTPTFPNAEYWISEQEWQYWTDPLIVEEKGGHVLTDVLPLKDSPQLKLAGGEAAITPELSLLPTPGHTPGHCAVAVASAGETAIILGDGAHHPLHLERIWIAAIDELPRLSRRTKRALVERLIEEQALVAAGHFASGSFGRMVRAGGQRRWQPL